MTDPAIIIGYDPAMDPHAVQDARRFAGGDLVKSISDAIELPKYDQGNLAVVLHNKLSLAGAVERRGRWWGGRFYNAMMGEDGRYIQLLGFHLCQVFPFTGYDLPFEIHPKGQYFFAPGYG